MRTDEAASRADAPLTVVNSAVLYVFRLLADDDTRLHGDCPRPPGVVGPVPEPAAPGATSSGCVQAP
ncbi:hypothetical protein [Streptomyces sp. NPDC005374]|uniref:hypothetical protein n=1 Tax=Streptomyces sp. NPDC005374 TaxID=3364713 RepID=UPI0036B82A1A